MSYDQLQEKKDDVTGAFPLEDSGSRAPLVSPSKTPEDTASPGNALTHMHPRAAYQRVRFIPRSSAPDAPKGIGTTVCIHEPSIWSGKVAVTVDWHDVFHGRREHWQEDLAVVMDDDDARVSDVKGGEERAGSSDGEPSEASPERSDGEALRAGTPQ